jgi:transcriptional regulator GlxA family with amidase domain
MKMIIMDGETGFAGGNPSAGAVPDCGNAAMLRIEQTITYMSQHLDKPLQVATLAEQANISPSHFFALFKRRIGSAPIDYFTRLRMQRACRLLENTSLSVKEVASELGYDDPFYFSRVFKSVNRVAPSDYRAAQRSMAHQTGEGGGNQMFSGEPNAGISRRPQFARMSLLKT